jgi:glycosyltransferase involved in cell wall biosynthesis
VAGSVESSPAHSIPNSSQVRKVLVVVDGFPATGGARIDKFVKFLPEFNIEPIVLASAERVSDKTSKIKREIYPETLKTYYAKSIGKAPFTERYLARGKNSNHYRLLKWLSFPERFLMIPDYMVRWIPHGRRLARSIVREVGVRTVLTSSPSESVHLIGLHLKRKLGLRWVADFRDLWTEKKLLYRPATRAHDLWIRKLERKVFECADQIIANTPENADRYTQQFSLPRERIIVIPNGFDHDDFAHDPFEEPSTSKRRQFCIGYAGSFDKHDFPWQAALQALKKLGDLVGRNRVRLVQCGYASEAFKNFVRSEEIEDLVDIQGELSHSEAMALIAKTDIRLLLLYENEYSEAIVPLKLYNYLIMEGPILAIAPEVGRTAKIIAETAMGVTVSINKGLDAVFAEMLRFFRGWESENLNHRPNRAAIAEYDRRSQTKILANLL